MTNGAVMSEPVRHREVAWVPMQTKGHPWFAIKFARRTRTEAQVDFEVGCPGLGGWEAMKKEGWRIVRVEVLS